MEKEIKEWMKGDDLSLVSKVIKSPQSQGGTSNFMFFEVTDLCNAYSGSRVDLRRKKLKRYI